MKKTQKQKTTSGSYPTSGEFTCEKNVYVISGSHMWECVEFSAIFYT